MNVYLLRHGEAESQADSDINRSLTINGQKEVINVAEQFVAQCLSVDRCLVSPYLRAQQTAKLFVPHLYSQLETETVPWLVPEVRASEAIRQLENIDAGSILLISHNPLLSELLAILSQGDITDMKIVDTSELNAISFEILGQGMGTLQFSLNPSV